ncbi:hypothetical protein Gotur_000840 [Gossypium turneri]
MEPPDPDDPVLDDKGIKVNTTNVTTKSWKDKLLGNTTALVNTQKEEDFELLEGDAKKEIVSLSAFAFLFSELVQYNQTLVDNIAELERRLEDVGYAVGTRVLELLCCWGLSDHLVLHPLDI